MPTAGVIPAPIGYNKPVAVKKLVVGFSNEPVGLLQGELLTGLFFLCKDCVCPLLSVCTMFTLKKIRVLKAGYCLNT